MDSVIFEAFRVLYRFATRENTEKMAENSHKQGLFKAIRMNF